jgi:excisionase family DNA binding protein
VTEPGVLTPTEVGALLRVSDSTVRRLVRRGLLPRLAGIGVMLIPAAAVDAYRQGVYGGPPDSLDAAWAEAEAALPEGWQDLYVERHFNGYFANIDYDGPGPIGEGLTPAAALRALAAKLRDRAAAEALGKVLEG